MLKFLNLDIHEFKEELNSFLIYLFHGSILHIPFAEFSSPAVKVAEI